MAFDVPAERYARFMGRWSEPLAGLFADAAGVRSGWRALDVGCGPGALTAVLVERLGPAAVAAVDPSPPFVAAARQRFPGVDVQQGVAERLPQPDATFDVALAQLVVAFMTHPVAGLREMGRVTRPGGVVAACMWDLGGGRSPSSPLWRAARDVDPDAAEGALAGTREGSLEELFAAAGLIDITSCVLTVERSFETFDEWWEPFTYGVGPAGDYVRSLDEARRTALRDRCAQVLPPAPFTLSSSAWCAVAAAAPGS